MNQPDFQLKQQNFSGVSQFYRSKPTRAYVVEVGLSSSIRGDILQEAVNATLRRMPLFFRRAGGAQRRFLLRREPAAL